MRRCIDSAWSAFDLKALKVIPKKIGLLIYWFYKIKFFCVSPPKKHCFIFILYFKGIKGA